MPEQSMPDSLFPAVTRAHTAALPANTVDPDSRRSGIEPPQ